MGLREVRGARAFPGCARILAGRYRLDALIGSGGAADVYRGYDLRLRRPVAVKVFRHGTGFDTEEAFRSEAVILARLNHPGLVTAFDAGRDDGDAFLVMQLIDGRTLKSRIAEGPLSCEAVAALGAALADALAHAHQEGIVHRDVKPSNILLDSSGRAHLTDFGISRALDATTRTAPDTLTGTAAYLSPEQVLGKPVSRPADIYALGLVLLESLTGRLEYDGGPLESAIARLHRRPELPDFLPDDFAALLRDMTSLEEHARPDAYDCAQELTRLSGTGQEEHAASDARPALSVVSPAVAERADVTHRGVPPAAQASGRSRTTTGLSQGAVRSASVRVGLRTRGVAAALAALLATGLAVTDGLSQHDSVDEAAPSASDPVAPTSPDTAGHQDVAPPTSATRSSRPSDSDRPLSDSVPVRDVPPPSGKPKPEAHHETTDGVPERTAAHAPAKGGVKTPKVPPGHARDKRKGKKTAPTAQRNRRR
ncbi:serine/threonine-protein kinase [Streptomyces tibetensis]|uniref:serine/threonine-protein kinase n=1 Tax=Streptomyces tibetensis TaxID=2382123 RepID=UPI003402C958